VLVASKRAEVFVMTGTRPNRQVVAVLLAPGGVLLAGAGSVVLAAVMVIVALWLVTHTHRPDQLAGS
jgi:hypothetical protein